MALYPTPFHGTELLQLFVERRFVDRWWKPRDLQGVVSCGLCRLAMPHDMDLTAIDFAVVALETRTLRRVVLRVRDFGGHGLLPGCEKDRLDCAKWLEVLSHERLGSALRQVCNE
jgi:hypothetical protein